MLVTTHARRAFGQARGGRALTRALLSLDADLAAHVLVEPVAQVGGAADAHRHAVPIGSERVAATPAKLARRVPTEQALGSNSTSSGQLAAGTEWCGALEAADY